MLVLTLTACGRSDTPADTSAVREDGPEHVHGLGVNPRDDALMVATHSGLFRLAGGDTELRRVGDLRQDTMGFTVVGPDRFIGSGHPDARTGDPPHLGLIESDDGGRAWRSVSLRGKADLHALTARSQVIFAYDALSGQLIASADDGKGWAARRAPGPVLSLALDPSVETRLAASTDGAIYVSSDAGATWAEREGIEPGLLVWSRKRELLHMASDGLLSVSDDRGRTWRSRGELQAEPVAITARGAAVHVADVEGRIFSSGNGGRTWTMRAQP